VTSFKYYLSFLAKDVDFSHIIYLSFSPTNNNITDLNLEIKDNPRDINLAANTFTRAVIETFAG
jgi:hypothetical protein